MLPQMPKTVVSNLTLLDGEALRRYCHKMTNPNDAATWWTAFGAIAQAIGAMATFLAVATSLWVVLSERAMKCKGSAGIRLMFAGDGSPGIYLVGIEALNVGVRPFHVGSVGWRTGWLPHWPKALSYRYAILNTDQSINNRTSPLVVEPGRSEAFYVKIADMKGANSEESRNELFTRRLPIIGYCPIWATIHITGRTPVKVRVKGELANFLRTLDHASRTDDAATA